MVIEKTKRHTIMDGRVVTYAPSFIRTATLLGPSWTAFGEFVISVSRNKIQIERCNIKDEYTFRGFQLAMDEAMKQFKYLQQTNGRPNDDWNGSPIKVHLKT